VPDAAPDFYSSQGSPWVEAASVAANGFLLAGGRSSRMGREKALLELDGKTLVEIGLEKLKKVCREVKLVGDNPGLACFGVGAVPDTMTGCGPLGGIVAGLEQSAAELNLFLAVDVPFVPAALLQQLLFAASAEDVVCVMVESCGQPQPLIAVYRRSALPTLRGELEAGRWKVMSAIKAAGDVRYLKSAEEAWFRNLNTPEQFAAASGRGGEFPG
jgi:molybdopterin-guanine dinucleotide biosynthesis protein A